MWSDDEAPEVQPEPEKDVSYEVGQALFWTLLNHYNQDGEQAITFYEWNCDLKSWDDLQGLIDRLQQKCNEGRNT